MSYSSPNMPALLYQPGKWVFVRTEFICRWQSGAQSSGSAAHTYGNLHLHVPQARGSRIPGERLGGRLTRFEAGTNALETRAAQPTGGLLQVLKQLLIFCC